MNTFDEWVNNNLALLTTQTNAFHDPRKAMAMAWDAALDHAVEVAPDQASEIRVLKTYSVHMEDCSK